MDGPCVRPVDESNVAAFVELLHECFGYSFSWPWVYEEGKILEAQKDRRVFFFLAFDGAGVARGLLGLNRSYPTDQVASMAPFVVDPRIGRADSGRYLQLLLKAVEDQGWELVRSEGLRAVVAQPVCEHRLTQRLVKVVKFVSTGLLLGATPGGGDRLRVPPEDRVGSEGESLVRMSADVRRTTETLVARAIPRGFPAPERVSLPDRFEDLLGEMYTSLRVPIEVVEPTAAGGETRLESRYDFHRSIGTEEVVYLGADAVDVMIERLEHHVDSFTELVHVVLPLGQGDPNPVVEALCDWGCKFAGLLPCYRTSGVLLLQHLTVPAVVPTEDQLVDPLVRRILRETILD